MPRAAKHRWIALPNDGINFAQVASGSFMPGAADHVFARDDGTRLDAIRLIGSGSNTLLTGPVRPESGPFTIGVVFSTPATGLAVVRVLGASAHPQDGDWAEAAARDMPYAAAASKLS